jgi:DNA-binding beta-propeller fold protein YncE
MSRAVAAALATALFGTACQGAAPNEAGLPLAAVPSEAAVERRSSAPPAQGYAGSDPAPDFPPEVHWFNTPGPLSLADLRGKVVLLDFWTTGCINCIHIIPELQQLETKYGDALVVIGVHSAKFDAEAAAESIHQAVLRYDLRHPVASDTDFRIWNAYGVQAWPTLVLIDPAGNVLGTHAGEGVYELFDRPIEGMIARFEAAGQLDRTPLGLALERASAALRPLAFPGKVLADPAADRLFIADSGHHRIVATTLAGAVAAVYGDGTPGFTDGPAGQAQLNTPQGMARVGHLVYVADSGNHAIRTVDLDTGEVGTAAGAGYQARQNFAQGRFEHTVPLNSPWDVVALDDTLYIAMAGSHQIWSLDPGTGILGPYAGSGREGIQDGVFTSAMLAQPSGLATDGQRVFFADAESSAIRSLDPRGGGRVGTLVGTGLFDFGDIDGQGDGARLQHPLGIAADGDKLYVADTYNNKLKVIDPATATSRTLAGQGAAAAGHADGPAAASRWNQPGGVTVAGGRLYVADTNNHVIRTVDLATGQVGSLRLTNLAALTPSTASAAGAAGDPEDAGPWQRESLALATQRVAAGPGKVRLEVTFPAGFKLNADAPFTLRWQAEDPEVIALPADPAVTEGPPRLPIELPVTFATGHSELVADMALFFCREGAEALCFIRPVALTVPVDVGAGGDTVTLTYQPPVPND